MTPEKIFSEEDIQAAGRGAEIALTNARLEGVLDPHHERNQMLSHLQVGVVDRIIENNLTTGPQIVAFLRQELGRLQSNPASTEAREIRIILTEFAKELGLQHELAIRTPGKDIDISPP